MNNKDYVSNYIDIDNIDQSKVNMILAGTGSGKSYWVMNYAAKQFNVRPCEILFVTSRSMTRDQQGKNENAINICPNKIEEYSDCFREESYFKNLIGTTKDKRIEQLRRNKAKHENLIHIINYNEYDWHYMGNFEIREGIKVVIFDEYHAMYSDITYNTSMRVVIDDILKLIKDGKIVIGMTATDDDIPERDKRKLNYLLYKPRFPYRVTKQFHIIKSKKYLPIIINQLEGKTIWLTFSAKDALKYTKKYPNSRAIISRQSEHRTEEINEEMEQLEEYIKEYKTLPDDVDILIGTSCIREGFEFREDDEIKSNIKNVIIHSSDPVTIKQFLGRYRHNVENLYVVYESHLDRKWAQDSMTKMQKRHHKEFKEMLYGINPKWFNYFLCIVADKENRESEGSLIKFTEDEQIESKFIDYMYEHWSNKLIYTKEQKKEIVDYAHEIGIRRSGNKKASFVTLVGLLKENDVEFEMEGDSKNISNEKVKKYSHGEIFSVKTIQPYVIGNLESIS